MLKKVLSIVVMMALLAYVVVAAVAFCRPPEERCQGLSLEIRDSLEAGYMTTGDVLALLKKANLDPTGLPLEEVSLYAIEEELERSSLVLNCECYMTMKGHVVASIDCKQLVMRVITHGGESYYLDEEGGIVERLAKPAYLSVATGYITREYAKTKLLPLAQYLYENEVWNAQVEQICVTPNGNIELIPRVGDHVIVLGRPRDYAAKFDKLKTFYEKGLSELGWDRYSRINLDYENQVVATKR